MESPTTIEFIDGDPTFTKDIWIVRGSPSNLILGDGWTSIARTALAYAPTLKRVTIPVSVTRIGVGAFFKSTGLEQVTFAPESRLAIIENSAFTGASSLVRFDVPASVVRIDADAFNGAASLKQVTAEIFFAHLPQLLLLPCWRAAAEARHPRW